MITGYFSADVKSLKYIKLSRGGIIMPVAYVHISMYCAAHACAEKKKRSGSTWAAMSYTRENTFYVV